MTKTDERKVIYLFLMFYKVGNSPFCHNFVRVERHENVSSSKGGHDRESVRTNGLIKGKVSPTSHAPQQLKLGCPADWTAKNRSKVALRYLVPEVLRL